MFEYKDSINTAIAFGLVLAGIVIDIPAIRIALAIGAVTFFAWPFFHRRYQMSLAVTLLMVSGVGLAIGAVWSFINWQISLRKPDTAQIASAKSPLDNTIQLECRSSLPPGTVPSYPFYHFQLIGNQMDGGVGSTIASPGSPYNWGDSQLTMGVLCRLTNFGSVAILKAESEFNIVYRETIKTGSGTQSGAIIETKTIKAPSVPLGVGDRNIAEFLFLNRTDYWVHILPPRTIRIQIAGTSEWQTVALSLEQHTEMIPTSIPPFSVTNPPASPPPTPEPPAQQETK